MNRIYEFLISLAVVIVLFAVVALFLPSKRTVEYKIESNRPISTVYDVLNGFNRCNCLLSVHRFKLFFLCIA